MKLELSPGRWLVSGLLVACCLAASGPSGAPHTPSLISATSKLRACRLSAPVEPMQLCARPAPAPETMQLCGRPAPAPETINTVNSSFGD